MYEAQRIQLNVFTSFERNTRWFQRQKSPQLLFSTNKITLMQSIIFLIVHLAFEIDRYRTLRLGFPNTDIGKSLLLGPDAA